jgi:hypothetical protein
VDAQKRIVIPVYQGRATASPGIANCKPRSCFLTTDALYPIWPGRPMTSRFVGDRQEWLKSEKVVQAWKRGWQ